MGANACPACAAGTDHCHGTLIGHAGRIAECTEGGCVELEVVRHLFVVECTDLAGGCTCAERGLGRLAG
ncbi:hypothetical protein [Nocardia sp. NPDC057227]|uniref:hypothetical protein n=1 Tax=Nocardia sp. NPDC057227 TaxID=3346056 RepID=UPI00364047BD